MQTIHITGGRPLSGTLRPACAKNSVLPLLAASLLCHAPCAFTHVPRLSDVDTSLTLLRAVGAGAMRQGTTITTWPVPDCTLTGAVPSAQAGAMRSSVFYLAPLLCRCGTVRLPLPGGCRLGPRPVDIHLAGLTAMGAQVELSADAIRITRNGWLHGTDFTLRLPSVGATLTLLMAATQAAGDTVLRGAACEPEIVDMARFLQACGASVTGAGTPVITVRGGRELSGGVFAPVPDRIAAATYAAAAACAGGSVTVEHCPPALLDSFLVFLERAGCEIQRGRTRFTVTRQGRLRGGQELVTGGWPAFATDTAPLAAAVLLTAAGESSIRDTLFQSRFACAGGFAALGADTEVGEGGRCLTVRGVETLHGGRLHAPDLRGGAALLLAALCAEGESLLYDAGHISRGYEDLPRDLSRLGALCR